MVGPRPAGWRFSPRRRSFRIVADRSPEESTPPAVNPDAAHIWSAIQTELKRAVPEHTYDLWLAPLRAVAIEGDTVLVEAPAGLRARLAERFGRVLQSCAAAVLGPQADVDVVAAGDVPRETPAREASADPRPEGDEIRPQPDWRACVLSYSCPDSTQF